MSKCKYTYMYFPLYKQVVLSEETVFNEGEGDTDPQALHHGIHLLRSLPRTRKITFFFTSFLFDKIMLIWYKIPHYQCGFCAVSEKWYFLVYGAVFRDFTKSTLMVFHITQTQLYRTEQKICDLPCYRRYSRKGGPRIECLWFWRI